jgi:hypothetical protein
VAHQVLYNADVLNALARASLSLLDGMGKHLGQHTAIDTWLPALLVALQSPLNGEPAFADTVAPKLHRHLLKVSPTQENVASLEHTAMKRFANRNVN